MTETQITCPQCGRVSTNKSAWVQARCGVILCNSVCAFMHEKFCKRV